MRQYSKDAWLKEFSYKKRIIKVVIFDFILAIALFGCAGLVSSSRPAKEFSQSMLTDTKETFQKNPSEAQQKETLLVGTAITEPFIFHDPETNELIGFDINLVHDIAKQLDVDVEFIEMSFANLIPALENNKVDMIIAAMYITPEREELVDFSEPYLQSGLVMVVSPELQPKIKKVEDLAGLRVGVKIGATGAALAEDLVEHGLDISVVEYINTFDSLLDLEVGRVDVVFNDYLNTLAYIKNSQSALKIANNNTGKVNFLSEVGLGIAVRQHNQKLLIRINASLVNLKQDNIFEQEYQHWLLPSEQ